MTNFVPTVSFIPRSYAAVCLLPLNPCRLHLLLQLQLQPLHLLLLHLSSPQIERIYNGVLFMAHTCFHYVEGVPVQLVGVEHRHRGHGLPLLRLQAELDRDEPLAHRLQLGHQLALSPLGAGDATVELLLGLADLFIFERGRGKKVLV